MGGIVNFFETLTDENTWVRVFYVVFGAALIYFALTQDTGRLNLWYGG